MPKDPERDSDPPDDSDDDAASGDQGSSDAPSSAAESDDEEDEAADDEPGRAPSAKPEKDAEADDDDEDEDEEPERRTRRSKAARKRRLKKRRKRPRPPIPKTEQEINAPDPQTLWMLGALAAAVLLMWGAARFACNAHPEETKRPREVATKDLAVDPKGAAVELQQRWATQNYAGAIELAKGDLAKELEGEKERCDAKCVEQQRELSEKVLTSGELLSRSPTSAVARVTSQGGPPGKQSFIVTLEPEGGTWKAVSRKPDTGAPIPVAPMPTALEPPPLPTPTAAPPSSAPAPPKPKPKPKPKLVPPGPPVSGP